MVHTLSGIYSRNEQLWGEEAQKCLFRQHVAVIGLGGVGGYIAESLARSGVGVITVVDFDDVAETDINRQLQALIPDIGKPKISLIKQRINLINPHIEVIEHHEFCTAGLMEKIIEEKVDFVADAIDTLRSKVEIIEVCRKREVPVISCLGAGNRIKPEELYLADISEVKRVKCPFVKNVVYQLKKKGIESYLHVVLSKEPPIKVEKREAKLYITRSDGEAKEINRFSPASSPFVPPVAGYIMAGYIVRTLIYKV
jgi:tRNA A37 threonylcarbamoyladenosine dehydratase